MSNYNKKFEIVDGKYYQAPSWIGKDFSGIPSREITFEEGFRLDIIAQQVYGNGSYWKAIAIYNDIGYFFSLQPGDKLYLPLKIKDVMDKL
jgi:hypothetical protein